MEFKGLNLCSLLANLAKYISVHYVLLTVACFNRTLYQAGKGLESKKLYFEHRSRSENFSFKAVLLN